MFFKNMNSAGDYGPNCVMCCNLFDFVLCLGFFSCSSKGWSSLTSWMIVSDGFVDAEMT